MGFGVELGAASTECGRTVIDRTRQKCVAVLWRTCMQGSYACVSLNSRLESEREKEGLGSTWGGNDGVRPRGDCR